MKSLYTSLVIIILLILMSSCANTMRAIENSELDVDAQMSDTIYLDVESLTNNPSIFIRATNTSDVQEIDFGPLLRSSLEAMGYTITKKPQEADYLVTANVLYMGDAKQGMSMNSVLESGVGGTLAGAAAAAVANSSWNRVGRFGLGVGLGAAAIDAVAGAAFKVKSYMGIVDIQIKERVHGGVSGIETAAKKNGSVTQSVITRNVRTDFQEYQTRIAVAAKQTNMEDTTANAVISDRITSQICGIFKI